MFALHTNIYITDICSKDCPSCYYPKGSIKMTEQMAGEIAFWIGSLCRHEDVQEYRCHFLGGEPLENEDVLFLLIDKLSMWLPETTKGAPEGKYVLFTNGDRLNYYNLLKLKNRHVKILLNPATDNLSVVEEKMAFIKSICGGVSLAVVADEINLSRLFDLANLAVSYAGHIRINRLYHGGTIPGYVEEYGKQMHRVFDVLLSAEYTMWPDFIMESTTITWPGPKNPNFCGKCFLVFDSDGSVRSCNADMGTKMGHIHTHHKINDFIFTHRWSAKNLLQCSGCEWITWCQGGCPYTRKLAFGTYDTKSPFCSVFKELFPRLYELRNKWINGQRILKEAG